MAYAKDRKTYSFYKSLGPEHPVWKNKPEVSEDAEWYYIAWNVLSLSRPSGFASLMPIPLVEMEVYCRLACIPEERRLEFVRLIRSVDLEYLTMVDRRKTTTLKQPKGA